MLFFPIAFYCLLARGLADVQANRLFEDLLSNYNKLARPVVNNTDELRIEFKLKLIQILNVHEKDQIVSLTGNLIHVWTDYRLKWVPAEYGGVNVLHIPGEMIWLPDIILYNNADGSPHVAKITKTQVKYTGEITWEPPVIYNSMCPIDIEWFPFDEQYCHLKFGSWTYHGSEINLVHRMATSDNVTIGKDADGNPTWTLERGIDIDDYQESGAWDVMSVRGVRHKKFYGCCPYPFIDITYYLNIRRKTLFYMVNLVMPVIAIAALSAVVFYLPSHSNNKINMCVSTLVSSAVFLLLLVEIIPPTSIAMPIIARYLMFTLILVSISIVITVLVLNIHYRADHGSAMSPWVRRVFIHVLPRFLFFTTQRTEFKLKYSSLIHNLSLAKPEKATSPLQQLCVDKAVAGRRRSAVRKAVIDVCYIADQLRKQQLEENLKEDWKFVAMVIDRCFLYFFGFLILVGTMYLLVAAPMLWDNREPITELIRLEKLGKTMSKVV